MDQGHPKGLCHEMAQQMVRCVMETDCFKEKQSAKACARVAEAPGCETYITGYYQCRRGLLDNRTRIQGPKFQRTMHKASQ